MKQPEGSKIRQRHFALWAKRLGKSAVVRIVFEATGPYHWAFETTLSGKYPLVNANPLQARRFNEACGTRAKINAVDV